MQFDAEDDDEENGAADAADGTLLLDQLTALGFLKVHVQEALQYTSTRCAFGSSSQALHQLVIGADLIGR